MRPLTSFSYYSPFCIWFFLVSSSLSVMIDQGISFSVLPEIREDPKISAINNNHNGDHSSSNNTNSSSSSSNHVLTTTQAGLFSSLFMLGFIVGVPLCSMAAPKIGTNRLIHFGLILFVIALVGTSLSPNFYVLCTFRFFVGFSEAGFMPFAVNLIDLIFENPDHCEIDEDDGNNNNNDNDEQIALLLLQQNSSSAGKKEKVKKTMYLSAYFAALPIGVSLGMCVGGAVGEHVNVSEFLPGWRCAFLFVDVSLATILMFYSFWIPKEYELLSLERRANALKEDDEVEEAARNNSRIESVRSSEVVQINDNNSQNNQNKENTSGAFSVSFFTAFARLVFHNIDFVCMAFGFALFDFLVNTFSSFATIMLVQGPYGISSSTTASSILGISSAICGFVGSVLGGYIVDHHFQKDSSGSVVVVSEEETTSAHTSPQTRRLVSKICILGVVCGLIAVPCALFTAMSTTTLEFISFFVPAMLFINIPVPGITVAILEVVSKDMKPYAMSISMEIMVLFGDLAAPLIAGVLSNAFGGVCDDISNQNECVDVSKSDSLLFADVFVGNNNKTNSDNDGLNIFTWWYSDDQCRWIQASEKSSGALSYCANISQVNRGLFVASTFVFLQIPVWSFVAWRSWKNKLSVDN